MRDGIDEKVANKIYDDMIDFAKYAFNKSHAAAYAVVAYQTAWLKYYYPVEFMAALMTSVYGQFFQSIGIYLLTCRQMGYRRFCRRISMKAKVDFSVSGQCDPLWTFCH